MRDKFNLGQLQKIHRFIGPTVARTMILGICVGLLVFFVEIAFAFILQEFLRVIGVMSVASQTFTWMPQLGLASVLALIFMIGALRSALQWAHFYLSQSIIEIFTYQQRVRLLDWTFHSTSASSGEVTSIFAELIANTASFLGGVQGLLILAPSAFLLFISLLYIAAVPTLIASICLLFAALFMRRLNKKTVDASVTMYAAYQRAANQLLRGVKNLLLLHIYGTQKKEELEIVENLRISRDHRLLSYKLASMKYAMPQLVGIAAICVIALASVRLQSMTPALLISYFYLFVRFVQMVAEATKTGSLLLFSWPHTQKFAKWWADHSYDGVRASRLRESKENIPQAFSSPIGWKLKELSFKYPSAGQKIINNFNLNIKAAETLVITGPSGAGKSTLLSLLLGGLEPSSGSVSLVLSENKEVSLGSLRPQLLESIGYVGPESFLIEGTIRENIKYGIRNRPSDTEIIAALEKAECGFVFEMPEKLNHKLTDQGQGLSAGQKQRLSLARALLRKPSVLILDEATSNVDSETEARLLETLGTLKRQMTIVAVTHRESLLKIADQHVRMELLK